MASRNLGIQGCCLVAYPILEYASCSLDLEAPPRPSLSDLHLCAQPDSHDSPRFGSQPSCLALWLTMPSFNFVHFSPTVPPPLAMALSEGRHGFLFLVEG